jgi:hypothetical protein
MFTLAGFVVLVAGASVVESAGTSADASVDISGVAAVVSELELDPHAASASKAIGMRRDFFDTMFFDMNLFDIVNDTS